jgi:hypothetical protein
MSPGSRKCDMIPVLIVGLSNREHRRQNELAAWVTRPNVRRPLGRAPREDVPHSAITPCDRRISLIAPEGPEGSTPGERANVYMLSTRAVVAIWTAS